MCNSLNEIGLEHGITAHSYNICVYGLAVCLFAAYVPNLSVSTKMRHIYYYLCFSCVWPIPSRFIWILAHTQANQSIAKNCKSCLYQFNAHTHFPYDLPIRRSHGGRLKLSMHIFTVITLEIHSTSTWKRSNYSEALLDATDNATNEIFRWK